MSRDVWNRRYIPERTAPPLDSKGGGRSPYQRGYAFEVAVRGRLERRGWFVMRAHASKGKVDLLAVHKDLPVLMIQAKRTGQIGSEEWNALCNLAWPAGAWAVVTFRPSPRQVSFYRLDELRVPRRQGRPWSEFDPADCSLIVAPPRLVEA